ncbi:unnamed protein product [Toxocara canis]|uniref:L27 domain-containing protein n=1 Tax=Toxocara canis TaxID=6265 RepID=A0A183UN18_TOXCA|nr:unnamed protein product [Toxocara canis]
MRRHGALADTTLLNARLAVRHAVAEMVADSKHTLAAVVRSGNIDNKSFDPIRRLALVHLESIYDRIQCEILSCGNAPPSSCSILKFLQLYDAESSKEIVQRFENRCISARMQEIDEWRKISSSPLDQLQAAPVPSDVPPLDAKALASDPFDSPSPLRNGMACAASVMMSDGGVAGSSGSSIISMDRMWSQSSLNSSSEQRCARSSSNSSQPEQADKLVTGEQANELDEIAKKVTAQLMSDTCFVEQLRIGGSPLVRPSKGMLAGERHLVVEHIQKMAQEALPTILSKTSLIPSAPVIEQEQSTCASTNRHDSKQEASTASGSSHRSDGNEVTCRYVPPKVATVEASVGTEWSEEPSVNSAKMVEVGVNTSCASVDESSDTGEDLSAGQVPRKALDVLLQRSVGCGVRVSQGISVLRVRSDGSVVSDEGSLKKQPTAHEWRPYPGEIVVGCSSIHSSFPSQSHRMTESSTVQDDEEIACLNAHICVAVIRWICLECVSAVATSRRTLSEEDSNNTLAHISPLPQQS